MSVLHLCRPFLGNAGAPECSGLRKSGPHACSAALAVAAVKLERKASLKEKAAITGIIVKSGIIRDSLVSNVLPVHIYRPPTRARYVLRIR